MAKYAGRNLLIKEGDGAGTEVFTTIGNMRTNTFDINNEAIDVTDKDGGQWKEIIAGGIKSMSLSAEGVLSNNAIVQRMLAKTLATDGTDKSNYQLVMGIGTFQGAFFVTKFSLAGEYNGAQTYSLTLESAGVIAYTANP